MIWYIGQDHSLITIPRVKYSPSHAQRASASVMLQIVRALFGELHMHPFTMSSYTTALLFALRTIQTSQPRVYDRNRA